MKNEIGRNISIVVLLVAVTLGGFTSEKYQIFSGICALVAIIAFFSLFFFLARNSDRDFWGEKKNKKFTRG